MKVKVTRKRDSQWFDGVKSLSVTKKGLLFSHVYVNIKFGEGASTHYTSKEHDRYWEINHKENPGMGMDYCEKVEIFEDGDEKGPSCMCSPHHHEEVKMVEMTPQSWECPRCGSRIGPPTRREG